MFNTLNVQERYDLTSHVLNHCNMIVLRCYDWSISWFHHLQHGVWTNILTGSMHWRRWKITLIFFFNFKFNFIRPVVEPSTSSGRVNAILHIYGQYSASFLKYLMRPAQFSWHKYMSVFITHTRYTKEKAGYSATLSLYPWWPARWNPREFFSQE